MAETPTTATPSAPSSLDLQRRFTLVRALVREVARAERVAARRPDNPHTTAEPDRIRARLLEIGGWIAQAGDGVEDFWTVREGAYKIGLRTLIPDTTLGLPALPGHAPAYRDAAFPTLHGYELGATCFRSEDKASAIKTTLRLAADHQEEIAAAISALERDAADIGDEEWERASDGSGL